VEEGIRLSRLVVELLDYNFFIGEICGKNIF